jgi:hypothetical protein
MLMHSTVHNFLYCEVSATDLDLNYLFVSANIRRPGEVFRLAQMVVHCIDMMALSLYIRTFPDTSILLLPYTVFSAINGIFQ